MVVALIALNWGIRKARKAMEKELMLSGMSREGAKRISAQYSKIKKDIMGTIGTAIRK